MFIFPFQVSVNGQLIWFQISLNGLELQVSPSPSPVLKGDKTEGGLGRTLLVSITTSSSTKQVIVFETDSRL